MWQGVRVVQVQVVISVLTSMDRVILSIISSLQSAITCLQWPAEYIIVFGLAEGKVKEERDTGEVVGGDDGSGERNMVHLLP